MSHGLDIKKDGTASMFSVGEVPWHRLGRVLKNAPKTGAEAIKEAGLDWEVNLYKTEGCYQLNGQNMRIPCDTRMVMREDTHTKLAEVGPRWTPLQNIEAFEWFNPFVENGQCSFETAGALYDGRRIWIMAKLNRDPMVIVGEDTVNKYLMLANNHDDKRSARVVLTPQRVVCQNTLAMAFDNSATKFLSVRHSDKIRDNLDKVREIVDTANAQFEATAEQYRELARRQISETELKKYVKLVFKKSKEDETEEEVEEVEETDAATVEDAKKDARKIENKIIPLFEGGRGQQLAGVKGTWWAAYQAINEHLNWVHGRSVDARLDNLWFGQNSKLNSKALDMALKMMSKAA
jgi:phage/plasmid-like protein (TIGR03299 family)